MIKIKFSKKVFLVAGLVILSAGCVFTAIQLTMAETPNPGHSWEEIELPAGGAVWDGLNAETLDGNLPVDLMGAGGGGWNCGDTFVDLRDNKIYDTVQIGYQCWMKQNLNIGTRIDGGVDQGISCETIHKYCYGDNDNNCGSNYPNYPNGGLYFSTQAMCGSTLEGTQGICPNGWHIPTHNEACILMKALDSSITSCPFESYIGTDVGVKISNIGFSDFNGNYAGYWVGVTPCFSSLGDYGFLMTSKLIYDNLNCVLYGWGGVYGDQVSVNYLTASVYANPVRCIWDGQ